MSDSPTLPPFLNALRLAVKQSDPPTIPNLRVVLKRQGWNPAKLTDRAITAALADLAVRLITGK